MKCNIYKYAGPNLVTISGPTLEDVKSKVADWADESGVTVEWDDDLGFAVIVGWGEEVYGMISHG